MTKKNILLDEKMFFHGIGENLFAYMGIMKYGILTQEDAHMSEFYIRNSPASVKNNADNEICISSSPSLYDHTDGGFESYSLSGISFIIKDINDIRYLNPELRLEGAVATKGDISVEQIVGILCDQETSGKAISALHIVPNSANYNEKILKHFCETMLNRIKSSKVEIKIAEIEEQIAEFLKQHAMITGGTEFKRRIEKFKIVQAVNRILTGAMQQVFDSKIGKENVSTLEVITKYNTNNLPIYTNIDEMLAEAKKSNDILGDRLI